MTKRYIEVKTQVNGFIHCYPKAPREVEFLRDAHRHTLFIVCTIEVFHDDRELEFYMVQDYIDNVINTDRFLISTSCEQYADRLKELLMHQYGYKRKIIVKVFEDNINGAIIEYTPE